MICLDTNAIIAVLNSPRMRSDSEQRRQCRPDFPSRTLPLKYLVGRAFQAPDEACGSIVKLDIPIDARFGDRGNHRAAEAVSFRRFNVGAVAFGPADRELIPAKPPFDTDAPGLTR